MSTGEFELPEHASLGAACAAAQQYFVSRGIEDAAVDAWYLLEYVTGISRAVYLADRGIMLGCEHRAAFAALVNQRGAHIPLQYLTREQEFMGLPFLVSEHVLIPRADTETLVEQALKMERQSDCRRVLDLCTGSGCVAISIVKMRESAFENSCGYSAGNAFLDIRDKAAGSPSGEFEMVAADVSGEALDVARENARRLEADIRFIQSDLFAQIPVSLFDMIVSNPPYIRSSVIPELSEEVREHEPRLALDGGVDGMDFYRRIIRESPGYLRPGGHLLLEIGYDQGEAVADLMGAGGFSCVQISKDLSGNDRVVSGQYSAANFVVN